MTVTLPVPMECSLPPGWRPVPPNEVSARGAAFVALHPPPRNGFTANITISGEVRPADIVLGQVADEALARLRTGTQRLRLGRRTAFGSAENPGLTQAVRMSVELNGHPEDIVQYQVYVGMRDLHDERRQVVLHVVLSSTPDQFDWVVGDFQQFISTIRPTGETP
jgi:hypothetical protein